MMEIANTPAAPEPREIRLKRLRLRSWRRGTREMDLILGRFADARLEAMSENALDAYEALLEEPDWDIYYWVTGARETPAPHAALVGEIAAFFGG
jgi:antitoxin CptB